jgi:hypothetical protein
VSAKDLPGGRTQVINICQIIKMDRHTSHSCEDSAPESISDTENWLTSKDDLDHPTERENECEADDKSDIEPCSGLKPSESPDHLVVHAIQNVPTLIQPIPKSIKQAEKGVVTVSAIETMRNKGIKNKKGRLGQ